jgi:hypothetical protein
MQHHCSGTSRSLANSYNDTAHARGSIKAEVGERVL